MPDFYDKEIDAKQARQLAEGNSWLLNHMYKEIRFAAAQNRDNIMWCIQDTDKKALSHAINELQAKGFTIENYEDDESSIIIKW